MNDIELITKFGKAKIYNGYYVIVTNEKGNVNKKLHRLIYEDFWRVKLPTEIVIHHKDGNKLNNCILNLEAMTNSEHSIYHGKGNQNWLGRNHSEESKQKISKAKTGYKAPLKDKIAISKSRNSLGYFRVTTQPCKSCKQGFSYVYKYFDETNKRHSIIATKIDTLKKKVLSKGLEWIEFGEVDDEVTD